VGKKAHAQASTHSTTARLRAAVPTRRALGGHGARALLPTLRKARTSIQCEHEQIARVLQLVVLHRMQVTATRLHGEKLLRADSVGHRARP